MPGASRAPAGSDEPTRLSRPTIGIASGRRGPPRRRRPGRPRAARSPVSTIARVTRAPPRTTVSSKITLSTTSAPASTTTPGPMTLRMTVPATTLPELSRLSSKWAPAATYAGSRCGCCVLTGQLRVEQVGLRVDQLEVRVEVVVRLAQVAPVALQPVRVDLPPVDEPRQQQVAEVTEARCPRRRRRPLRVVGLLVVELLEDLDQHVGLVDEHLRRHRRRGRLLRLVGERGHPAEPVHLDHGVVGRRPRRTPRRGR